MPDYYIYRMRHGESWVQALIENLERQSGIKTDILLPLEQRWAKVMDRPELDETPHVRVAA